MGREPAVAARDVATNLADQRRRLKSRRRIDLYSDNASGLVTEEILRVFESQQAKQSMRRFIPIVANHGLYKRIVDEISRPIYMVPPTRTVSTPRDQEYYFGLCKEMRLDQKMELATRLVFATNASFLLPRYVESMGRMVLDVLSPDQTIVIPHPDDPTQMLGFLYASQAFVRGNAIPTWVFWDDVETLTLDAGFKVVVPDNKPGFMRHAFGRIPVVAIHRTERSGHYWDETTGEDLENAQLSISFLMALTMKLHKSQGFKQLAFEGDMDQFPVGQVLSEEGSLMVPEGTNTQVLDFISDPGHYLKTVDVIMSNAGANHGISKGRLNQDRQRPASMADEIGLLERRTDAIQMFRDAEKDLFEVVRMVSAEHPTWRLSDSAEFTIDFSEIEAKTSRKTQLEIRELEERRGLRNILDDIKEDQPEIVTDDEARAEFLRNLDVWGWRIEQQRALNAPASTNEQGAGADAQTNGALGPIARDSGAGQDGDDAAGDEEA